MNKEYIDFFKKRLVSARKEWEKATEAYKLAGNEAGNALIDEPTDSMNRKFWNWKGTQPAKK